MIPSDQVLMRNTKQLSNWISWLVRVKFSNGHNLCKIFNLRPNLMLKENVLDRIMLINFWWKRDLFQKVLFISLVVFLHHRKTMLLKESNKHILTAARALKFQSNISLLYWSDCVLTTDYLISRLPCPILGNKSP